VRRQVGSSQHQRRRGAGLPASGRAGGLLTVPDPPVVHLGVRSWPPDLDPETPLPAGLWRLGLARHLQLSTELAGPRLRTVWVSDLAGRSQLCPVADWDRGQTPPAGTQIYISGPMSGYDQNNVPMFTACAYQLRRLGYRVVSPVEQARDLAGLDPSSEAALDPLQYQRLLELDLEALEATGWLVLLGPAPWASRGVRLELRWAVHRRTPAGGLRRLAHWVGCPTGT